MSDTQVTEHLALARNIADIFARLPEVEAVALGGSVSTGNDESGSDIDLYIYITREIPVAVREEIIERRASRAEMDNHFAEPADEWVEGDSGIGVDLMYRHPDWIEDELDRVLRRHEASLGYSTAFWHNVLHSMPLFDRSGWFGRLQALARQPYPEELRRAIIAKNHPMLREAISSWLHQLEKAVSRGDRVLANQKVGRLLASYFDILFALNRMTHPGEKRLLKLAARCEKKPPEMDAQVLALLEAVCSVNEELVSRGAGELLDGLDRELLDEGLFDGSANS